MDALKSIIFSRPSLHDTLVSLAHPHSAHHPDDSFQKLVVIGGTVETARRVSVSAWNGFVDCMLNDICSFRSDVVASLLPDRTF